MGVWTGVWLIVWMGVWLSERVSLCVISAAVCMADRLSAECGVGGDVPDGAASLPRRRRGFGDAAARARCAPWLGGVRQER